MLVCWFCDLNYVGTLVYAEMIGRHYDDLDLHGGRAAGAGRRHPPSPRRGLCVRLCLPLTCGREVPAAR